MTREVKMDHAAVNAMLPDIPEDFEAEMTRYIRMLPERREHTAVRRIWSMGLALALALMLLAAGAVAAVLLGGKAFVNDVMAPLAGETESQSFTEEEIARILSLAAENGVTLPDSLLEKLNAQEDGYDKEELMRAFAKTELGFYPGSWSIEDQAWYGQLLVACKVSAHTDSVLPEGDEIKQEAALEIIYAELEKLGADRNALQDAALYRRSLTYHEVFESEYRKGRMWSAAYDALDPFHDSYSISLWSDGRVDKAIVSKKGYDASEPLESAMPYEVQRFYQQICGAMSSWSEETWLNFQRDLRACAEPYGVTMVNASMRAILRQTYAVPDEASVLPREAALRIAREMTGAAEATALYMLDGEQAYWKVTAVQEGGARVYVEINAQTGEAGEVLPAEAGEEECRPYVLEKNMPMVLYQEAPAQPAPTARPDGKRSFWGCDVLPDAVWSILDALNYNSDTASKKYNAWCRAYGEDQTFWPHEIWALDYLAHEIISAEPVSLPGVPLGNEIPEEQIIEKAWGLTSELENFSKRDPDTLRPVARIWYGLVGEGSVSWVVTFVDVSEENYGERALTLRFDAYTGEAVHETRREITVLESVESKVADGDFPQAEAEKLARDMLYDMCSHRLTRAQSDALWMEWKLMENWYQEGDRVYYFEFGDDTCTAGNAQGVVIIDACTGAILDAWYEPVGNG